jgi:UDP-glucose:glycoprotein glucosyltransferase
VDWSVIRTEYVNTFSAEEGEELASLDDILLNSSFDSSKIAAYVDRLGVASGSGHAFVNGKHFDLDDVRSTTAFSRILPNSLLTGFPTEYATRGK